MTIIRAADPPGTEPQPVEHHTHGPKQGHCREHGALTPLLPLPTPSDGVDYHAGPEWHVCSTCRSSWLCREKHAHGHPGCRGKE